MAPASRPAPKFDRDWFTYRGRDWRIYKRGKGNKARWYLYFEHKKKRINHCLGDIAKPAAIETAKLKIDAILDSDKEAARKLMQRPGATGFSTVGELLDTFATLPGPRSAGAYAGALIWVLRKAAPATEPRTLSCQVFGENIGQRFFTAMWTEANACDNQRAKQRLLRSAASMFNQAKAVFSVHSLAALKNAGVVLPDVTPFCKPPRHRDFKKARSIANSFEAPDESVTRKTLVEWVRLGRSAWFQTPDPDDRSKQITLSTAEQRNMFLAIGLELSCGLRAGEVSQCRWNWVATRSGIPVLRARESDNVEVKNQSGQLEVVPLDPFWTILQRIIDRNKWRGKPTDTMLRGTKTECEDTNVRRISAWMRRLGWTTSKTNHALRDYGASLISMKYGLDFAKRWCRHASITTTEKHYSRFVDPIQMIQRKRRLKWLNFAGEERDKREKLTPHKKLTTVTADSPPAPPPPAAPGTGPQTVP